MNKIKAALLSYGMSGKVFHAPFINLHDGFELAGSWERSKHLIQQDYPLVKSYPSFEAVLEDDTLDLIIVNTPTATHFEYAERALHVGKNVVVEKAFTSTVEEAIKLKNLAATKGKLISVFQNRRWDSDFKTVKKIVDDGVLGDLIQVSISYDRFTPGMSPKLHKEIPGPGSGLVKDLGSHLIDQALVLFGLPVEVFAEIAITRPDSKVDDYFEILLFYPTFRVRLLSSYFVREQGPAYVLHGTRGSFLKSRADVQEKKLLSGKKPVGADWGIEPETEQGLLHTEENGNVVRRKVETLPGNYMAYYDGVYAALTQKADIPVSADEGIQVMKVIEAALRSNREKHVVPYS